MPMPTTSPLLIVAGSMGSSVSSTMIGSPQAVPVAEATTYSQRGVITATPKDFVLGLIRWTRPATHTSAEYADGIRKLLCFTREAASVPRFPALKRMELLRSLLVSKGHHRIEA